MSRARFKLRLISFCLGVAVTIMVSRMTCLVNTMPRVSVSDVMFLNAPSVMRATNSPVLELELLLEKSAVNTLHGLRPNHSSTVFNITNSGLDGPPSTGITAKSSLKNTSKSSKSSLKNTSKSSKSSLKNTSKSSKSSLKNTMKSSKSIITFSKNTLANTATKAYSNSSSNSKIAYNNFTKAFNKESLSSISTAEPFKYYMTDLTDISFYDPYLETLMDSKSSCQNASSYDAIMAVHSAPNNVAKRNIFRWLYTDYQKTSPYKIKVFFFIGQVNNLTLQSQLSNESRTFQDLVQGSFLDSYKNLTYKAIFVYKWLSQHCQGPKLLLRVDDDVYVRFDRFFEVWRKRVGDKPNTILCDVKKDDPVTRTGKWAVKESDIPEASYGFQHCLGYFAALTFDIVRKLYEAARKTPFFWIDDVFMYGFAANKVKANFVNSYWEMSRTRFERIKDCLLQKGAQCNLMSAIVNPENFKFLHDLLHNRTIELNRTT
ncbi:beta-1,3-galactosyltransferase 2-like [Biomphalaria glabrata]|uniref:Hexosyltransferase n=1 Tax=Biomphalaria glabrata TaxID=6526 RepID=A0A9W2YIM4_BIOGL|nr:beta-1,3-galactosyltransferase 2-like [Biomphalaria glabrata]XP_055862518.1 beta-1,3-galactosyltransferase 2-like [Biomphalaria glabrata]XP_055862519.1 beta-1,3-galactosyltransferase 2-like [Biomphalaria glabrata]XP_055862520.1 beta-1,3-galactosyltransferase 2-like [Biomphalaria glabrata]